MASPFALEPETIERIINGVRNALTGTTGEYVSKFSASHYEVSATFERHKSADDRNFNINLPTGATGLSLDAVWQANELRKLQGTGPNA